MRTEFKVYYFSGTSSKRHEGTLLLLKDRWKIYLPAPTVSHEEVTWELDHISRKDSPNAKSSSFQYGDFPHQSIDCNDPELIDALNTFYPEKFPAKVLDRIASNTGWKSLAISLLIFIAVLVGIYFVILPGVATLIASTIPRNTEISLGEKIYESSIEQQVQDTVLTKLTNDFAKEINFDTDYPIHITVVKSDVVNAYALPGGHIVVFDQILKEMKSQEELAALLSHEVSHIKHRHSLKNIFKSLAGYAFISFLTSDVNGLTALVIENANSLNNLKYSRGLEEEADQSGIQIMEANHIDDKGFVNLFHRLEGDSLRETSKVESFLSTHPVTKDRIKMAEDYAAKQKNIQYKSSLAEKWMLIKNQLDKSVESTETTSEE